MKLTEKEITIDYIKQVTKAIEFIDANLNINLTLESVSKIVHYSSFHFHRIFKIVTNETINAYITRKRIEKAASVLMRKKEISITDLSFKYGFNSNSSFTRAFKKFYGVSPTSFRNLSPSKYSKIGKVESKNGQETSLFETYICNINNHKKWIAMHAKIEVKELNKIELAYINQIGIQGLSNAFDKLMKWATPKGLLSDPNLKMATIYHDSLKITDHDKARMNACIVLNKPVEVNGEVGLTSIEKGKFIVGHFKIGIHEFEKAWTSLFIWMNENGYKKSEQLPFEIYHNNFNEHPEKLCIADLHIPIE